MRWRASLRANLLGRGCERGHGVEEAGVIAAPEGFEFAGLWRIAGGGVAGDAGTEDEALGDGIPGDAGAVPVAGREDGPADGGEALCEEGGGEREDAMLGAIPGEEVVAVLDSGPAGRGLGGRTGFELGFERAEGRRGFKDEMMGVRMGGEGDGLVADDGAILREGWVGGVEDFAKAQEGLHGVEVAAHLSFQAGELEDIFVGLLLEEVAAGLEAEEDAIEEVPALRVAMRGDEARGVEEGGRGVGVREGRTGGELVGLKREGERRGDGGVVEIKLAGVEAGAEGVARDESPSLKAGGDGDAFHCWMRWR